MAGNSPVDDDYVGDSSDMLSRDCDKVLDETARLSLLRAINKRGLCTRDVLSFATNQADLRFTIKTIDSRVTKNAMRSKIRDSVETLRLKHMAKARSIKRYLEENGNKKYKLRKALRCIKSKQQNTIRKRAQKDERKIIHLEKVMEDVKMSYGSGKIKNKQMCPSRVPDRLKDYHDLCIFRTSKDLPRKQEIVGPYLCHPDIALSVGERKLLSHSPKFSLMQQVDRVEFDTEIERGLCKHRFNEHSMNLQRKKKNDIEANGHQNNNDMTKASDDELLKKIWEAEAHRYVYNPFDKEIDFSRRRPTDYKLNSRINLPKPLPTDDEFQCEVRKRLYKGTFEQFTQENKNVNERGTTVISTKKEEMLNLNKDRNARVKKRFMNLTKIEKEGMISLKKRIKDNDIMVIPTDKSGRFSVMNHEQYLEAGKVHTDKDLLIAWDDVRYLKNQVNSHMWWLAKIWSYSKHTDPDRMLNNLTVSGLDLPEMSLLTKDHKAWSWDSEKPVPTRPIMSGNSCINTHLSELISEVVEPLVLECGGSEVQSSEEVLAQLDQINEHVRVEGKPPDNNYLEKFRNFKSTQDWTSFNKDDTNIETASCQLVQPLGLQNNYYKEHVIVSEFEGIVRQEVAEPKQLCETVDNVPHENISPRGEPVKHTSQSSQPLDFSPQVDPDQISQPLDENISLNESDLETVDILTQLGVEAIKDRNANENPEIYENEQPPLKRTIGDYFQKITGTRGVGGGTVEWLLKLTGSSRNKYNSNEGTLNE